MTEAYCVKCKKKVEMKEPTEVKKIVKGNPRKFLTATCSCGTSIWRIMPNDPK